MAKKFFPAVLFAALALPFFSASAFADGAEGNSDVKISGMSLFSQTFSDIVLKDAEDALAAYLGGWIGSQTISVGGRSVMDATVQENCVGQTNAGEPRILVTGTITSQNGIEVPIHSTMYVRGGELFSDIRTASGELAEYRGFFEGNFVIWVPKYFVMQYDWQKDSFYRDRTAVVMFSQALKYIELKAENFSGMLAVEMRLTRDEANFPVREVQPFKAVFGTRGMKPKMGD